MTYFWFFVIAFFVAFAATVAALVAVALFVVFVLAYAGAKTEDYKEGVRGK